MIERGKGGRGREGSPLFGRPSARLSERERKDNDAAADDTAAAGLVSHFASEGEDCCRRILRGGSTLKFKDAPRCDLSDGKRPS